MMEDIIVAVAGVFLKLMESEKSFIFFILATLILQYMTIWFLVVALVNKNIMQRRRGAGMREVKQAILAMHKMINSHYQTLAQEQFGEDFMNRKETAIYRYMLTMALDERKPDYEERIRKNHFNEKTPEEWHKYVTDNINEDITQVTNYLDLHYHPQAKIPRKIVYDWNMRKIEDIKRIIEELHKELLCIAKNNKLKRFIGIRVII